MLACSSKDRQAGSQAVQRLTALHVGCAQVLWRNCIWLWSCSLGRQESEGELQPCGRQLFTGAWQLPESSRAPMSSLSMFFPCLSRTCSSHLCCGCPSLQTAVPTS